MLLLLFRLTSNAIALAHRPMATLSVRRYAATLTPVRRQATLTP